MPKLFNPRKSDAHRLACLTLYRALLKQCNTLTARIATTQGPNPSPLHDLIHYRFRRDSRAQSPYAIRNALEVGYANLQTLVEANDGSTTALHTIISTLKTTASHADHIAALRHEAHAHVKPPSPTKHKKLAHIRNESAHPSENKSTPLTALPLPLSELKVARRSVPYLNVAMNRVPYLRWPGHTRVPVEASRVMRHKLRLAEVLHDKRLKLETTQMLCEWEDEWDVVVGKQLRGQAKAKGEADWEETGWDEGGSWAAVAKEVSGM